jgi:hypothetical protein
MSDGTAVPDAMSPEARIARALNLLAAGVLAILCLVAVAVVLEPMPPHPADYGEGRGWGIVMLAVGLPFVGLFWLAAEGFRRHARWRWLAQLAALSPLWLSAIAELLQALGRLR